MIGAEPFRSGRGLWLPVPRPRRRKRPCADPRCQQKGVHDRSPSFQPGERWGEHVLFSTRENPFSGLGCSPIQEVPLTLNTVSTPLAQHRAYRSVLFCGKVEYWVAGRSKGLEEAVRGPRACLDNSQTNASKRISKPLRRYCAGQVDFWQALLHYGSR